MDAAVKEHVKERLKALGLESSPEVRKLEDLYHHAFEDIVNSKNKLEEIEAEEHGSLKYAVSSIDMDLNLVEKKRGQSNYQNLLGHINSLEKVTKELLEIEELCLEAAKILEWINQRQGNYEDFNKNDLDQGHKEAEQLAEKAQRLINEIESIAEDRIEVVKEYERKIESDRTRWSGSTQGLEYALKQLRAIHDRDF